MVYVANSYSFRTRLGTVTVVDGKRYIAGQPNTGKAVATIKVGRYPDGIAVDPATDVVYVANGGSNTVSVIDGRTNRVTATIGVPTSPTGVGVVPSTDMVYVADSGNGGSPGQFSIVDSPGQVSVIDGRTNRVVRTLAVGYDPEGVGVNSLAGVVYVSNGGGSGPTTGYNGTVSVIRGTNVVATISVGGTPGGIGVDQLTNTVYVANSDEEDDVNEVDVVNNANRFITRIQLGDVGPVQAVAVDAATHAVFVADRYSGSAGGPVGSLSVINGKTSSVISTVSIGGNPWGVAVDPTTGRVYVAIDTEPGAVAVVDFRQYPIVGGTPPPTLPVTAPTTVPRSTTTTTPPPPPSTVPPPTTLPAANTMCALLDKAGGAALGGGEELLAAPYSGLTSAINVACSETNSLRWVYLYRTTTESPPGVKPYSTPSGLGVGAELWVIGNPYTPSIQIWFRRSGAWIGLVVRIQYPPSEPQASVAKLAPTIIAVARKVYSLLP
jgi:YVTN family beta-propeller protein